MFQRRFGIRSASQYAWIVPAVVVLALVLIYFFGDRGGDYPQQVVTLERTDSTELLQIGDADNYQDLAPDGNLSAERRESVLQSLSELRAEYKLLGPKVTIAASDTENGGKALARALGGLFASYDLGQFSVTSQYPELGDPTTEHVLVYATSKDAGIARGVAAAIAPVMAGRLRIVFDDSIKTGNLWLVVVSEPEFSREGVAVFQ